MSWHKDLQKSMKCSLMPSPQVTKNTFVCIEFEDVHTLYEIFIFKRKKRNQSTNLIKETSPKLFSQKFVGKDFQCDMLAQYFHSEYIGHNDPLPDESMFHHTPCDPLAKTFKNRNKKIKSLTEEVL